MRTLRVCIDERDGAGYPVRASLTDGPTVETTLPATALPGLSSPLGTDGIDPMELERFGDALHRIVCSPELRGLWDDAGRPARVVLELPPKDLGELPWELLYDGDRMRWMFADTELPIVRAVPGLVSDGSRPPELPIRMLVLVGAPEQDDREALGVDDELAAIYAAVRGLGCLWQVDVLDGANQDDVRHRFVDFAPHVLHFIGHGTVDAGGRPALETALPGGDIREITPGFVVNALSDVPLPRLVVLNACRTSGDEPLPAGAVTGLTTAFLRNGAAAVVSMQGDVEASTAVRTSSVLYSRLAAGDAVDVAVARVYRDLAWADGVRTGDWALPTLTVRGRPEDVLPSTLLARAHDLLGDHAGRSADLRWLVDRTVDRYQVMAKVAPDVGRPRNEHIAFLTGDERVGKSWVARSCVLIAWQRRMPVVHVELPLDCTMSHQELVEHVAQAVADGVGTPEARDALVAFRVDLAALPSPSAAAAPPVAAGPAGPRPAMPPMPMTLGRTMPGVATEPGAGYLLRPRQRTVEQAVYEHFHGFLRAVAAGETLLVVIDNVGEMIRDDLDALREHLFVPAERGDLAPVRLLVVQRKRFLEAVLRRPPLDRLVVALRPFARKDVARLVAEFCTRRRADWPDVDAAKWGEHEINMRSLIERFLPRPEDVLSPEELQRWEDFWTHGWRTP